MLKEKLLSNLRKYEAENKRLSVKWNAGGDETILNFFLGDENISYFDHEIYHDFASYLIEEFDLPNAGEYYNDGGGEISIEDESRILFEYDEYAYGVVEEEDLESENREEFLMTSNGPAKQLLEELNQEELTFEGSTSFLLTESDEFEVYAPKLDYRVVKEKSKAVQQEIKREVLTQFTPPFEGSEIGYSGTILEEEIIIEELYQIKYQVDKYKKKEKMYLLE